MTGVQTKKLLSSINEFARLASNRSELVGACFVLVIIVMMVIPLSPVLLDILIAVNISATIVLVVSAMLLETPLKFSSFPAILLMTTLFRLALTISTTRQILLEADAGHIIQTFGEFVIGGNVTVGLIMFLILAIVNFLVVTKGSERVAEVAARFSLDGMPGKQMSIDSDLRAGNITQAEGKQKRAMLEKESQLFGAMDGAIKFVKNDAIAGLIITAINLIGGIAIGMLQKDMTLSQAGSIYSVLTVGDGLIGIIPSLLTSVAAGLIVTRVTKGEADGSSTAQDMILDLTSNARALQISGLFCACFALVPGMPAVVFLVASALLLGKSFFVDKGNKKNDIEPQAQHIDDALNAAAIGKDMEDITLTKTFLPMEVKIPGSLEPNLKQMFRSICKASRNQLIEESGALYPTIDFSEHAAPQIEFHVFGVPMLEIDPSDRRIAVFCEPSRLESLGIDVVRERDPILGRDFYLTEPVNKNSLDKNNISYCCFEKRWSNLIIGLFVSRWVDYFNLNDFQRHVARLSDKNGEQLKELERVLPLSKVTEVFQKLLIERVSVKNIRTVLNCLIDWAQRERDVLVIAEQVRKGLFEQISFQHCVDKTFSICTLSPDFEQSIRESIRSDGSRTFIDADASSLNLMVDMIEVQYSEFYHFEKLPLLITSMDCRAHVRMLIQDRLSAVPVLSYQEISNRYGIKLLKSIEYDDSLISINHDTREA